MHPIQEHTNTLGIHYLIQRLTEYIYEYERNRFPTQSVKIKLWQHQSTPAQQTPRQKKSGNLPVRESNPWPSACLADAQTTRPPASRGYTTVKLMYLWVMLGGHREHYKHHNTLDTDRRSITWCLIMSPAYEYS